MSKIYQDWEPVVLKKKNNNNNKPFNQNPEGYKKDKILNSDEIPKIVKYTPEQSQTLMQLRKIKNINQEELAKMLNINVSNIKEIENMSGIQNIKLYNIVIRKLNAYKSKE